MSSEPVDTRALVQQYFRMKAAQLRAVAALAVCQHPALVGSHREALHRTYLRELLPARFSVGRGMVYSIGCRSREADIVIWDSQNYPCLPLLDHSFFFAESVRLVIECKSVFSTAELKDVFGKCASVRDLMTVSDPMSLTNQLQMIKQELFALQNNLEHYGALVVPYRIGTAAIFLSGGASLTAASLSKRAVKDIDESWPDVLLLLEAGRVFIKDYNSDQPILLQFDLEDDALLLFTDVVMKLLRERSSQIEPPLKLMNYGFGLAKKPASTGGVRFPVNTFVPGRIPLWD